MGFVLVSSALFCVFACAVVAALERAAALDAQGSGAQHAEPQTLLGRTLFASAPAGYVCPNPTVVTSPTAVPSNAAPSIATGSPSLDKVLRGELSVDCSHRQAGNVTQKWSVSERDGAFQVSVTTSFVVRSSNWLVTLARDTAAIGDPQRLARYLLGESATPDLKLDFHPPVIDQPPDATPSPSASSSPSPFPTPSSLSRTPSPLSTVVSPQVTTVTLTGDGTALPGERVNASFTVGDVVRTAFELSGRLEVDAGPARIVSVSGGGGRSVLRNSQSVVATPDDRLEPTDVVIEIPTLAPAAGRTVVLRGNPHTATWPNLFGIDSLVYGVISSLDVVVVVWALLRWRRRLPPDVEPGVPTGEVAARRRARRRATAVINVALVSAAVGVAGGLFSSLEDWDYRYGSDVFGGRSPLFVPGAQVAVVAFLAVGVPILTRQAARAVAGTARAPSGRSGQLTKVLPFLCALLLAAGVATAVGAAFVIHRGLGIDWTSTRAESKLRFSIIAGFVAVVVLIGWLGWWIRYSWATWPQQRTLGVWRLLGSAVAAATVIVLGGEAQLLYSYRGDAVTTLVAVVPATAVALAVFAATELLLVASHGSPVRWRNPAAVRSTVGTPDSVDSVSRVSRLASPHGAWALAIALLLAVVVAVPGPQSQRAGTDRVDWSAGLQGIFTLRSLLTLAVFTSLVITMWADDRDTLENRTRLRSARILGGCLSVLLWSPVASWWFLPVAFATSVSAIRYVLLPRSRLLRAEALLCIDRPTQDAELVRVADAAPMRKALDARIGKTLEGIETDTLAVVERKTSELRAKREQIGSSVRTIDGIELVPDDICFGHAAGTSAWGRGRDGAIRATLLALPWIALSIKADVTHVLSSGYHYRLGQFLLALPFDVVWWSGLGFVFGWTYPLIRGSNGLGKARALFVTIAIPLLVTDLFPGPASRHIFVTSVQTIAETASVLLVLGVLADYELLRNVGFGFAKLVDMQKLSAVVTWATSLTIAIGAAVTSVIVTGVTGALIYLSHPSVPPGTSGSNPQVTQHGR